MVDIKNGLIGLIMLASGAVFLAPRIGIDLPFSIPIITPEMFLILFGIIICFFAFKGEGGGMDI